MGNQERSRKENTQRVRVPRKAARSAAVRKQALAKRIAVLAVILCLVIVAGIFLNKGLQALKHTEEDDGLILKNVTVAGINIGGMTPEAAENALRAAAANSFASDDLVVHIQEDTLRLSPANTGAKLDVEAAIEEAYSYGRSGGTWENAMTRLEAEKKEHAIALLPYLNLDLDYIRQAVEEFSAGFSSVMTQPSVSLSGQRPEYPRPPEDDPEEDPEGPEVPEEPWEPDFDSIVHQTLTITMGTPEFILRADALYDRILDAYSMFQLEFDYQAPTLTEPDLPDLEAIFEEYCLMPEDATIDDKTFEVVDEIYGYGFDIAQVTELVLQAQYGQQITITLDFLVPDITRELLTGHLFKDELAAYVSICNDDEDPNRDTNLRLACEAINGYVLKSGEVFNFNKVVGPRTANRGYLTAPNFSGSNATSIGGGISQIASALHYCALVAELEVTERHSHTYKVGYSPFGTDAAITYGSQNLCFVNNTEEPMRILASVEGSTVHIQLLGTKDESKDYQVMVEYELLSVYAPGITYRDMAEENPQGYVNGQVLQQAITGYDVQTFLCKYDVATGELISRDALSTNSYQKRDAIVVRIEGAGYEDPTLPPETSDPTIPVGPIDPTQPSVGTE